VPAESSSLIDWAMDWAQQWTKKGLTTPVQIKSTARGVAIYFDPTVRDGTGKSRVGLEGGVELIVDAPVAAPDKVRLRARRFAYADGAPLKTMSEDTIVRRLKDDVARLIKERLK
jgi:hypothetical protein